MFTSTDNGRRMEEISIKNVCCTCLSTDRSLSQLCRIENGVNNLFFLLSYKSAKFIKDVTKFFICWECTGLMHRFTKFRDQACIAQSKLMDIANGEIKYSNIQSLSKLSVSKFEFYQVYDTKEEVPETFVDCGPEIITVIKSESDSDDVPLAQLRDLKSETSIDIDIDEVTDDYDDLEMLEGGTSNYSEIRKSKSTSAPISVAKYENKDIFYSKTESDNKDLGIFEKRHKKKSKTIVKRSISELKDDDNEIDYENALDSVIITPKSKKKIKKKNVVAEVYIPIMNGDKNDNNIRTVNKTHDNKINKPRKVNEETIINGDKNYSNISTVNKTHDSKINKPRKENEKKNEIPVSKQVTLYDKYFNIITMTEAEMIKNIEARKLKDDYVNAMNKCESCIEIYLDSDSLLKHISEQHQPKPDTSLCNICKVYVKLEHIKVHKKEHYLKCECRICKETLQFNVDMKNVASHLRNRHLMQETYINERIRMLTMEISRLFEEYDEKPDEIKLEKKLIVMIDDPKGKGFACWQCKQYFKSKSLRHAHIEKVHKEGYQCPTCGKKFPFSNTLKRHEMIHCSPLPREQCTICGKMVRGDLVRAHASTHASKEVNLRTKEFSCKSCNKTFTQRQFYERHLKYSRMHTDRAPLKYKCGVCGKDYRSPGELRDHYNYNHMQKTHHKCPICDKALATPRCITKHIKRAHQGVQEKRRDKICQTCGKAFKCKLSLSEHERTHSSERPLSCDICARSFRQKAALYTHKRLVHKVALKRKIQHTDEIICIKTLSEHERTHTGERPLSCDICARTFRQKASLYTHKRLVHKVALKKKIQHTDEIIVINSEINKNND